jgi:hypothetical protein
MPGTSYTPVGAWSATNRYTASGEVPILIGNPSKQVLFWMVTADDTEPVMDFQEANPVAPYGVQALTLADTERLWIAGSGDSAVLTT